MRHRNMPARMRKQTGAVSLNMLVLFGTVFVGLMGFAVDLGRLYLSRGELRTAAESMALSAAGRLIGTEASTTDASAAARRQVETGTGFGNRYEYGAIPIGESTGFLNSEIHDPTYWATASESTGEGDETTAGSGEVAGSVARHVRIELTGEAPLVFWRFLSLAQEGKVAIRVRASAGVSAPLCTACGIDPIAIAPIDPSDTVNFGFVTNTRYTFGYTCAGPPPPQPLAGTTQRLPYVILNRLNEEAELFTEDSQQLFRTGAVGLLPSTTEARSCITINAEETIWATASQLPCNSNTVQTAVRAYLCGLATRMDISLVQGCNTIAEVDTLNELFQPDTDLTDLEDYTGYIGNTRRVITVVIVEALNPAGTMVVLGFRQFLLQPVPNNSGIAPSDANGRIAVTYIGNVVPLKQGRFGGCQVSSGPGKVVLHR